MYIYSRHLDGTHITLATDFPMTSENMIDFQLDGYPFFLNYEKWHISMMTGTQVDQQETKTVTLPILCAPASFDLHELENNVGEFESISDEEFSIMIKVNDEGLITALMMQDQVYLGSGFPEDPDWKPIIHYYPELITRHAMYRVPVMLLSTPDDVKLFIYFWRSDHDVLKVKYHNLNSSDQSDFNLNTEWNTFKDAFTYVTDIEMEVFNQSQAQRDQFLESSAYGLLAYVTR